MYNGGVNMIKQGNIEIASENMMPIIKKWLYSDKDIFLREIVANAVDAITKYKKLADMGECEKEEGEYCVKVSVDKKAKTLTVEDNGIGMTDEEVEKYITQIAFSGAADFLQKYEKAGGDGIIGHFGLGFYSAYMVSENVEIYTKSYLPGSVAVHWESDGEKTYTMEETEKEGRGTKVVMHIEKEEKEFLEEGNIKNLLEKYCSFMQYPIYLNFKGKDDKPVNDTNPLYMRNPKDCKDEEYLEFYKKTFHDYQEPLFWIHLNMDYPFRLKGILYFPKARNKVELERGKVKLYCNQVFIADNIKEVIPEYLMLLNGVIDCPDIPLNVSRSFLQNDRQVQKISKHIVKKVADKLTGLYKNDREKYEKCWTDLSVFVKVGCVKDESFYEKVRDIVIFKDLDGVYTNLSDFREKEIAKRKAAKEEKKEEETVTAADEEFVSADGTVEEPMEEATPEESKEPGEEPATSEGAAEEPREDTKPEEEKKEEEEKAVAVYYVTDEIGQAQYISMFRSQNLNALVCDHFVDPHFMNFIEYKEVGKYNFLRIDADINEALKEEGAVDEEADKKLSESFKAALKDEKVTVKCERFKSGEIPAVVNVSEYERRYNEMGAYYGMEGMDMSPAITLVINTANDVISSFASLDEDKQKFVANQVYYLAKISYTKLSPEEIKAFSDNSVELLKNYIG